MSKTKVVLEVSGHGGELSMHKMTQAGQSMLLNGAYDIYSLWSDWEELEEARPELTERGFANGRKEGWYSSCLTGGMMPLADSIAIDVCINDEVEVSHKFDIEDLECVWEQELNGQYYDELAPDDKVPDELEPIWVQSTYEKAYGDFEIELDEEFDKDRLVYSQIDSPVGLFVYSFGYRKNDNSIIEFDCHNGFGDGHTKGTEACLCYKRTEDDWGWQNFPFDNL